MTPDDRLAWLIASSVGLSTLCVVALLVIFGGVYTIRYRWERSGSGRGMVAVLVGTVISKIGGLYRFSGSPNLADILSIVGNLWVTGVLIWGVVFVIRGSMLSPRADVGGITQDPPQMTNWRGHPADTTTTTTTTTATTTSTDPPEILP